MGYFIINIAINIRKPLSGIKEDIERRDKEYLFNKFPKEFLNEARSFREIQSLIINLAHEFNTSEIPSDEEIKL